MQMGPLVIALSTVVAFGTPAGALTTPPPTADAPQPAKPQKLICTKEIPIGSRLGGRETCVTPEGMASRRLQERQGIERAQAAPCLPTHAADRGGSPC